jgi:hypothetical protein
MRKLYGLFVGMLLIVAIQPIIGASGNIIQNNNYISSMENKDNANWVLMFYQNGDNKLSPYIGICLNLLGSVGATDDVKIAVLIDKKPINDTTLYYFEGTTPVEQDWPAESDMSDPETLVQFAEKVMNDYPSENYMLEITANKGSGWQGVCYDEHGDGIMITMPEIHDALDTITENGCFKIDVVLIQSCLAGNHAFRYQISQFCNYFVSYADCGLVGDIPFDIILADVVADPTMSGEQFAINIVDNFEPQQIQEIYQAMGATDSNKIDELSMSIDELADWFLDNFDTYNSDIQTALVETRRYGLEFNIDYFVDLKDFLDHLSITDSEFLNIKNSILNNIEETVIANVTLEGHPSCGFNFYFPDIKNDYNNALRYDHALPSPYEETLFALNTDWDEFLKKYLDLEDNTPPDTPTINGPDEGSPNQEYEFTISADDSQGDNICFYIEWGDGTFEWTDLDTPGEDIILKHTWETKKSYEIKVKSIDQYCAGSDWGKLKIDIPRSKAANANLLLNLFRRFVNIFPTLQILLERLN